MYINEDFELESRKLFNCIDNQVDIDEGFVIMENITEVDVIVENDLPF